MHKRNTILLLSFVFIVIGYSQIKGLLVPEAKDLPNPRRINGEGLANVPPVGEAIAFIQNKIRANPKDAVSYTLLGDLYLRQARETGEVSAYLRAEESLSKALELLPGYSPAGASLASTYYSTHEFEKALDLAEKVYQSNPKNLNASIIVADSYLSIGQYEIAESIYNEIGNDHPTPPLLARLANVAELKGEPDKALTLIRRAAGDTLRSGGTRENAAWYLLRVGDVYFNRGEVKSAGEFYEASLRVFEDYYLGLAGLGKVRAAQGQYDDAIAYYQKAVNILPQPELIAALGDLFIIIDQPQQADLQYKTVEYIGELAAINRQVYNRQLANFYSDHNIKLEEALRLALTELTSRKDIYGYDAAAWAYYKNGEFEEAQGMMNKALVLGTRDARLYYHAGMIAFALQDNEQARGYLELALAINPHFSILQSVDAQKTLEILQATASK